MLEYATTSPTRWKGTRAPPVNGVADGGKMDTETRRRRLSGSISRAGKGCATSRAVSYTHLTLPTIYSV